MARIECGIPGGLQSELLKGRELINREKEAWRHVLGAESVPVEPLPKYVTSEVHRNLVHMGFGLRYIPSLNLDTAEYIRRRGVDVYLAELQQEYPKWKPFENLSRRGLVDYTVPRNLHWHYWNCIKDGSIDFPKLPGQWMAVETIEKPPRGEKYRRTPFAETLKFADERFQLSWNKVYSVIEREKHRILEEIGLAGQAVDIRMLEALEWNLLANREGWGKTNSFEWTNTEYRDSSVSRRLVVGNSEFGGAGYAGYDLPGSSNNNKGFRVTIVFDAWPLESFRKN